eukprot:6499691-Pyramimonas_sp.AAC.1
MDLWGHCPSEAPTPPEIVSDPGSGSVMWTQVRILSEDVWSRVGVNSCAGLGSSAAPRDRVQVRVETRACPL